MTLDTNAMRHNITLCNDRELNEMTLLALLEQIDLLRQNAANREKALRAYGLNDSRNGGPL